MNDENKISIIEISAGKNFEYMRNCLDIRRRVFIVEQNVPQSIEIDDYDEKKAVEALKSVHVLALYDGACAGTGRLVEYDSVKKICKIGRLSVLPEFRKRTVAAKIFEYLIKKAEELEYSKIIIHAQCYVTALYERFGFVRTGGVFDEAGLEHVKMCLEMKK